MKPLSILLIFSTLAIVHQSCHKNSCGNRYFIEGVVTNKKTNAPVSGLTITVNGTLCYQQDSDANGEFLLALSEKGNYQLELEKEGFRDYIVQVNLNKKIKTLSIPLSPETVPGLTTDAAASISYSIAHISGSIDDLGAGSVNRYGLCWSTFPAPTLDSAHIDFGSTSLKTSFSHDLTGLLDNTTYYLRAYAENAIGVGYGNEVTFQTNQRLPVVDPRDSKSYLVVDIGTQTWLQENFNFKGSNAACYDNDTDNCLDYGSLYPYATAVSVCPQGWHLPTQAELKALIDHLGGSAVAFQQLAQGGSSGFDALMGGHYNAHAPVSPAFEDVGTHAYFWSATHGISLRLSQNSNTAVIDSQDIADKLSVRCILD